MDAQLDYDEREMEQWHQLSSAFKVPRSFSFLRRVPIFGRFVACWPPLSPYISLDMGIAVQKAHADNICNGGAFATFTTFPFLGH